MTTYAHGLYPNYLLRTLPKYSKSGLTDASLERNNGGEFSLIKNFSRLIPTYAIVSHTWGPDTEEVNFQDLINGT